MFIISNARVNSWLIVKYERQAIPPDKTNSLLLVPMLTFRHSGTGLHSRNIGSKYSPKEIEAQTHNRDELPEVERSTGHQQVHGVADLPIEAITQHPVALEVANERFDGRTATGFFGQKWWHAVSDFLIKFLFCYLI